MRYIKVIDGEVKRIYPSQPKWICAETGEQRDDEFMRGEGVYPLVEEHDLDDNYIVKDQSDWIYGELQVEATYYQYLEDIPECNLITHKRVLNDESEWVVSEENSTITKTYTVAENSTQEMVDFVSSVPVFWPEGFNIEDYNVDGQIMYIEKPMEQWTYDESAGQIIKTYWTIEYSAEGLAAPTALYYKEQLPQEEWTYTDTTASEAINLYVREPDDIKDNLISMAADIRYQIEVGGIVVGTDSFDTSRESQSKFAALYQLINSGEKTTDVYWKTADGFKTFSAIDFKSVCSAVFTFVDTAYEKERLYIDEVNAAADALNVSLAGVAPETIDEVSSLKVLFDEIYTNLSVDNSIFINSLG